MLTYRIEAKQTKRDSQLELLPLTKAEKKRYVVGSPQHKQSILDHALRNTIFKEGDTVETDIGEIGSVTDICPDATKIEWKGLKPLFIGVFIEEYHCSIYYHYSELSFGT